MTVTLKEIDRDNWRAATKLTVAPEQESFVASNVYSLAEAKVHPDHVPLAIYDDDTMVGFVMYTLNPADGNYWIFRLMIDAAHQGKGYGRAAMEQTIRRMLEQHNPPVIMLSYVPGNDAAAKFYASLGFEKTGEIVDGEVVVRLPLSEG